MERKHFPRSTLIKKRSHSQGFVLIVALIGLAAMTIAASLLTRSVASGSQISTNLALRSSVERSVTIGLELAMENLLKARHAVDTKDPNNYLDVAWTRDGFGNICSSGQCWYYPTELFAQDDELPSSLSSSVCSIGKNSYESGIPMGIPSCDPRGKKTIAWFDDSTFKPLTHDTNNIIPPGFKVRYVVDRLCSWQSSNDETWNPDVGASTSAPKATNILAVRKFCRITESGNGQTLASLQTMDKNSPDFSKVNSIPQVYYRITVQVIGPRATTHFAQAVALI